jgi:hypothetical protein
MRRIRNGLMGNQTLVITSLVLSFYLILVYYLGVFYTDSYVRWNIALDLIHGTRSPSFSSYLSIFSQVLMVLTYKITTELCYFYRYTSIFIFYSSLVLLKEIG